MHICKILCLVWFLPYFTSFSLCPHSPNLGSEASECWCILPMLIDELGMGTAVTNCCCGPATMPSPVYCFNFVWSFVTDRGFVCEFLLEICRGWGLSVLFICQKYLDTSFKCSIVLGFLQLLYDFFSCPYFHYLLRCVFLFFWFIMECQFNTHVDHTELFTNECKLPS